MSRHGAGLFDAVCARSQIPCREPDAASIADFLRQALGRLIQRPTAFSVGTRRTSFSLSFLAHRGSELFRIAVFEFLHRVDADMAQQFRIALAEALDPELVGKIGETQQLARIDPGLQRQPSRSFALLVASSSLSEVRMPADFRRSIASGSSRFSFFSDFDTKAVPE